MDNRNLSFSEGSSNLIALPEKAESLKKEALGLPSIDLDWQQTGDLEMLMSGAYAPLLGFMNRQDYEAVLEKLSLADGTPWPLPVTLSVQEKQRRDLAVGSRVALRDGEGFMLAMLTVEDIWKGDVDRDNDLIAMSPIRYGIEIENDVWHIGGTVEGVSLPMHHDFSELRLPPADLRSMLAKRGWCRITGWMSDQPMSRAHYQFCLRTAMSSESSLLLLPFGGGDLAAQSGYFTLIRTYLAITRHFPAATTQLAMLPIIPKAHGLREKLMRIILARNYGCEQIILESDSQVFGTNGNDLLEAKSHLAKAAEGVGVKAIWVPRLSYVEDRDEFLPEQDLPAPAQAALIDREEFDRRLHKGLKVPDWYVFPEVKQVLETAYPPREKQGLTIFFTGLSGAGKSTLAKALANRLLEVGNRQVTLLDGDIVRRHLSSELGFSHEHRVINVRRIGYVASEITKNRGVAICAPIAPYRQTRRDVRKMIEAVGGFIEVHVSTPIETCELRDRKGLYAKARAGLIPEFTGVSDPYEVPENAELALDTTSLGVEEAIQRILLKLEHEGYLR